LPDDRLTVSLISDFCHLTSDSIFARASNVDVTPAVEKFCEILRQLADTITNVKNGD